MVFRRNERTDELPRNNLIDGWRGLSVLGVVIAHLVAYRFSNYFDQSPVHTLFQERASALTFASNLFFRFASPLGEIGVNFFFVISGYLITYLLIAEYNKNSRISIAAFYARRVFRIVPAFYALIATLVILRSNGTILLDNEAFVRSGLYVCNVSEFKCGWWLAHTWSLSVEEQFYIVWPLIFSIFTKARVAAIWFIFLGLTISSVFLPAFGSFAHIAIGALVASSDRFRLVIERAATTLTISGASLLIFLQSAVQTRPNLIAAIQTVEPALLALIFFGTIAGKGPFVWILSRSIIQKIGLISYSVYLWQQLFTARLFWGRSDTGAAELNNALDLSVYRCTRSFVFAYGAFHDFSRSTSVGMDYENSVSLELENITKT